MKWTPTLLEGVLVIEPDVHRDSRGFFLEVYHQKKYQERGVLPLFVQDNHSSSTRGTLRGMHTQLTHPQGKLIRVIRGEIFDVVADVRQGSPTYKKWFAVNLSSDNCLQCYVPPGYVHGFCVLSDVAEVEYKCTDFYDPSYELCLIWNDPDIGIEWPIKNPILSEKDRKGASLSALQNNLPLYPAVKQTLK